LLKPSLEFGELLMPGLPARNMQAVENMFCGFISRFAEQTEGVFQHFQQYMVTATAKWPDANFESHV